MYVCVYTYVYTLLLKSLGSKIQKKTVILWNIIAIYNKFSILIYFKM